jgi:hypothetical protein
VFYKKNLNKITIFAVLPYFRKFPPFWEVLVSKQGNFLAYREIRHFGGNFRLTNFSNVYFHASQTVNG